MSTPASTSALAVTLTPAEQARLEHAAARRAQRLDRREKWAEILIGGGFVAAAAALLAAGPAPGALPWPVLGLLVAVFAVVARVRFDVGAGFTVPTQLVFMPMLTLLPAAVVAAAPGVAFLPSGLPDILRRRTPIARLALSAGDSWFAVGPALVLVAFGDTAGGASAWWVYAAAVAAQLTGDFAMSWLRELIHGGGASPR